MKEEIDRSTEITAELAAQISALQQALFERGRAIVRLDAEIHNLQRAIADQRRELEQQQQSIVDTYLNSLSWKLTRPLRFIGTAYRKAKSRMSGTVRNEKNAVVKSGTSSDGTSVDVEGQFAVDAISIPTTRKDIVERTLQDILDRASAPGSVMDGYVHRTQDQIDAAKLDVKAIAFYSPKFCPSDDNAYAESETSEWAKVVMAAPRYFGHYQPHIPGGLGFYDLRLPGVMREQVQLARQYGIWGFCFQHYWYGGKDRFGSPLREWLSDSSLNLSFCICWMNRVSREEWEFAVKPGSETSRPAAQEESFLDSVWSALADPRYVRVDGKPLLIISEAHQLLDAAGTAQHWRNRAAERGSGLYLVAARTFDIKDPREIGFDAVIELPPHEAGLTELSSKVSLIDTEFKGQVWSYSEIVERHIRAAQTEFVAINTVMTGWDDEAQNPRDGESFTGATPALYGRWLQHACELAKSRPSAERLVFINAWNDWSNGAHLEPDRRFGYAHLHVTANVLQRYYDDPVTRRLVEETNAAFRRTSDVAIILHCYYEDLIEPIFDRYISQASDADLFVTTRPDFSRKAIEEIRRRRPNVFVLSEENRGRDVRPFLLTLRRLNAYGYKFGCKIHTKKASHLADGMGEVWRQRLIEPLLGSADSIARAMQVFSTEADVGLLAPQGSIMDLRQTTTNMFNTIWLDRLLKRINRQDLIENYAFQFPAGSMFWFRVAALDGLDNLILGEDAFEPECGQIDGTLAHAIERFVALFAEQRGYQMKELS